jgi:hypothetical protein
VVINNSDEAKTLLVYSTDSQKSTDGSFACKQFLDEKTEVGAWIGLEEEVRLESFTSKPLKFSITVPDDANVGETNGCIMIQEKIPEDGDPKSGVSLSFRTGIRVVVTVAGEQIRQLDIAKFNVSEEPDKIKTSLSVANSGNVSIDTRVKVFVNSIFGVNIVAIDNEYPVLRGETSTYNFEFEKPFWGGFYNVHAEAEYDPSAEAAVGIDTDNPNSSLVGSSVLVFIMPTIGALAIELTALALIVGSIIYVYKRNKIRKLINRTWGAHKVRSGENLTALAREYGIDWKLLAKVNKLKAPYELKPGSRLKVPDTSAGQLRN